MKVNLRIVGIFCNLKSVDVGVFVKPPTVRDVMSVIRSLPGSNFTFTADDEANPSVPYDKASLLSASYTVTTPFTSPSGNFYPADVYTLGDSIDSVRKVANVFQYYLLRPLAGPNQFESISSGNKFIPFGKSDTVMDGDTIVWRQVSIKMPNYQMKSNEQFKRLEALGVV
jgi:hypothetical protein